MPKQRIYSVHQRSVAQGISLERELGVFTDDAMANQAIDHLYRYAWGDIIASTASVVWFDPGLRADIMRKGFDVWAVDDKNSDNPIFFKRPHDLWNQVPPSAEDFKFRQESVDLGVIAPVEVKRPF